MWHRNTCQFTSSALHLAFFVFYCIHFTIVGLKTQLQVETITASAVLLRFVKSGAMSSKIGSAFHVVSFNCCLYISPNMNIPCTASVSEHHIF